MSNFQKPTHKHINKARLEGGGWGRKAGFLIDQQPRRGLMPYTQGVEQRRPPPFVGG